LWIADFRLLMPHPVTHLPDLLGECDNTSMQKSFYTAVNILAAGVLLLGNTYCLAQETPAATTQPASPPKTQKATTPKSTAKPGASGAGKTQAPLALKTQKDKFSYALGMNLGANLHKQSVPVDPNIMARGLKDALAGGKTLLTEEEARAAITTVQNDMREKQQAKMQAAGGANKKEGEAFLADNKSKEGVIALPSGLQYKVLKEGNGPKPTATDSVVCNYRGTLINGTEFDSSTKHGGPATFPVNGVIKGWTEALQLMPVGSKWQLFVPSDLAYADRGAGGDIGPNATLIFEVELVSIQNKSEEKK
jgi:FKBP-type peptidyl-prolyl cis-trans isomerase FklB